MGNVTDDLLVKENAKYTAKKTIEDLPTLPQSMEVEMNIEDNLMELDYDSRENDCLVSFDIECKHYG